MLTFYATAESLYCAKLRILLRHKKLAYDEVSPQGGCGSDAYRRMIPSGTMPALVDGDLVLADSEAIAEYLEETRPEPAMLPRDAVARARCRERSRFHDTRLEPEVRALFPHIKPGNQGSEAARRQTDLLNQRFDELSRLLASDNTRDPEMLTLGECGFPISFAWIDRFAQVLEMALEWPQNVKDYRAQIEALDAVATELKAYQAGMDGWLQSKGVL